MFIEHTKTNFVQNYDFFFKAANMILQKSRNDNVTAVRVKKFSPLPQRIFVCDCSRLVIVSAGAVESGFASRF
jgi:hypothetical protein